MRPIFGQRAALLPTCSVDLVADGLAITSPYSAAFVADLKAQIPGSDRKWEPLTKRWIVSPAYGSQLQRLIERHYNESVSLPQATGRAPQTLMRLLDVRYLGAAKAREDGTETAYGWHEGQWSVIFPKPVLLSWFGQTAQPNEAQTLYGVLGVSQDVDATGLKAAWKRLARTWHPDVSKEPGSREQFQALQEAYEILSNQTMRAKYNAGLALEAMSKAHTPRVVVQHEWRAPLRCGLILCEGQSRLGRFVVSKVLQWADIVDSSGRVLVTTWAAGDDKFSESWVSA